jgi:hypothetical protein
MEDEMQASNKSVIETLISIDRQRIPDSRLRGLKPSVIRFCFAEKLVKDYAGFGILLSPKGVAAVREQCRDWQSVSRAAAEAERNSTP